MKEHGRIKEERLKILKRGYEQPDFMNYIINHTKAQDTCSDMASGGGCGTGCDVWYTGGNISCNLFVCIIF